jgi:hypothetical protein
MDPLLVIIGGLVLWTACLAVLFAVLWRALRAEPDVSHLMPQTDDATEREVERMAAELDVEEAEVVLRSELEERRVAHLWN